MMAKWDEGFLCTHKDMNGNPQNQSIILCLPISKLYACKTSNEREKAIDSLGFNG